MTSERASFFADLTSGFDESCDGEVWIWIERLSSGAFEGDLMLALLSRLVCGTSNTFVPFCFVGLGIIMSRVFDRCFTCSIKAHLLRQTNQTLRSRCCEFLTGEIDGCVGRGRSEGRGLRS